MNDNDFLKTAYEAYIFGYPLILMDLSRKVFTNAEEPGLSGYAPVNQFSHRRQFPDHNFTAVVKPNCDTYYSSAWLDLKQEPMVLSVEATDRYYLLPILDAYSNVFASPGKRTTGTDAHDFLIAGPFWNSEAPEGMKLIKSPTNIAWVIGRTQVNNAEDGEKVVVPFQNSLRLVPLSKFGKDYTAPKGSVVPEYSKIVPVDVASSMSIAEFFSRMAELLEDNPPSPEDNDMMEKLASIGIVPGKEFTTDDLSNELREKINAIPGQVLEGLKKATQSTDSGNMKNGWNYVTKPIADFGKDYQTRAFVGYIGLGANLPEDAVYPNALYDIDGNILNSDFNYKVHFEKDQVPPVNAFWSLTMYNHENFLAENPIGRYAIGDRDKLEYNSDGSLDIYIQRESPGSGKESNWLPAPKENTFQLTLRLYWPKQNVVDRTWMPPTVKKV